jgi:hypothetical protein
MLYAHMHRLSHQLQLVQDVTRRFIFDLLAVLCPCHDPLGTLLELQKRLLRYALLGSLGVSERHHANSSSRAVLADSIAGEDGCHLLSQQEIFDRPVQEVDNVFLGIRITFSDFEQVSTPFIDAGDCLVMETRPFIDTHRSGGDTQRKVPVFNLLRNVPEYHERDRHRNGGDLKSTRSHVSVSGIQAIIEESDTYQLDQRSIFRRAILWPLPLYVGDHLSKNPGSRIGILGFALLGHVPAPSMIKLLLERGVDPNEKSGRSTVWQEFLKYCYASVSERQLWETVEVMLNHGADPFVTVKLPQKANVRDCLHRITRLKPEISALLDACEAGANCEATTEGKHRKRIWRHNLLKRLRRLA